MECEENRRSVSQVSSRQLTEEVGEPDLDLHWTQDIQMSESLKLAGLSVWLFTKHVSDRNLVRRLYRSLIRNLVKLSKVNAHSSCLRVGQQAKLISCKGRELDSFKDKRFKSLNSLTFPHLISSQNHTHTIFSRIFVFLLIFTRQLCVWSWNSLPPRFSTIYSVEGWFYEPQICI